MLTEINGRKGGREMTVDEVRVLSSLLHFQRFRLASVNCFWPGCRFRHSHAHPPPVFPSLQAMAAFPESAKKINQDIADNKWFQ